MNSKQITLMIIYLFASTHMTNGILGKLFNMLNAPKYGKLRNSALTTASAMETLFTDYKSYFDNFHSDLSNSGLLGQISGCNRVRSPEIIEKIIEPVVQSTNIVNSINPAETVSEVEAIPQLDGA